MVIAERPTGAVQVAVFCGVARILDLIVIEVIAVAQDLFHLRCVDEYQKTVRQPVTAYNSGQ